MRNAMIGGIVVLGAWTWVLAGDAASPRGDPLLEDPTLVCLGVYWIVDGDDNANARVEVEYRRAGDEAWRRGQDLFRVEKQRKQPARHKSLLEVPSDGWLLAGSIVELQPDTAYEIRLALTDPDTPKPVAKTLTARTRAEPVVPEGLRKLHVVPGKGGGSGDEKDPYRGLPAALAAAKPGTILLLHQGTYAPAEAEISGEEGKPIVIASAGDGEAVIDAAGKARGLGLSRSRHVWVQDLTVTSAEFGIVGNDASDMVIRRCQVRRCESGIWFAGKNPDGKMQNILICDNVVAGTHAWGEKTGAAVAEHRGINITGRGHSICYNRVLGFKDGIDTWPSSQVEAIDVHHNEVSDCLDDGAEMDFSERNTRNFRNRYTNVFQGVSVQPVHGGPVYVFRNVLYNVGVEPFKMHNSPSGALFFHNTVVKAGPPMCVWTTDEVHNCVMRNNLLLGGAGEYACDFTAKTKGCDFDYDGFGGGPWRAFLNWNGTVYKTPADAKSHADAYRNALTVGVEKIFASGIKLPESEKKRFDPAKVDLRLAEGTAAIDAGQPLRGFNEGFRGAAPDLGANELGDELTHYGPRVKMPVPKLVPAGFEP